MSTDKQPSVWRDIADPGWREREAAIAAKFIAAIPVIKSASEQIAERDKQIAERDKRIAELEREFEAARKDAERKHNALKEVGLFLHHAWCDIQMNEYSFDRLNRVMELTDAAMKDQK